MALTHRHRIIRQRRHLAVRPATTLKLARAAYLLCEKDPNVDYLSGRHAAMKLKRQSNQSTKWGRLKNQLRDASPEALLAVIRDLYQISGENRRFLEARFLSPNGEVEHYRDLVREAINPDPMGRGVTSVSEAKRLIREYEQATHNPAGVADLRLTFVEEGTDQALDYGAGDEKYFASMISMLNLALRSIWDLSEEQRRQYIPRLRELRDRGSRLAWGYGDYLRDALEQAVTEMDEEA